MIARKMHLLITFHTTAGAMAMEKRCRAAGLAGRLIPVPREITADCGLAWRGEPGRQAPARGDFRRSRDGGIL